MNENNIIIKLI